ncbi:FKBP-type peptidyl-prolyl cis-trans isomerase [Microbacterium imperiale]|uniref:peptidylprolyl isomerase n=1 Tax=Microbacterium imperiale TaxID=33884 RepID=A0A9W6HIL4_9MICO|nr:FKBP-type peptidyl-prolyl cis-trans isomerase [Microbacterium imperiale]MBP2421920.1 peptidylprolyl isomerase [Microbacterium imperiale]MDS0198980.1 FKBP-type peptidyl-prolyl cis-trans isomerase [Microbacterium imperiale]BFE39226.1 FKBP-type peptidyl-prolyl cis-trans isomerase [Microbacterium imperiale]GLJ81216.1 peptidylprolyl isomerase [Microbacterium imperiale]
MRLRPLAALSVVAVSALALAGCAGGGEPTETPSPDASGSSQCLVDAQPGESSNSIEVEGSAPDLTATVTPGIEPADIERTVTAEGDGEELVAGDLVSGAYAIYDGATGELLESSATTSADDSGLVPILLDPQQYSVFVAALECAPLGSTAALAIPGSAFGEGRTSVVVVAEGVEKLDTRATGKDQEPVDGMPAVELAEDGAPTITIPEGDAPTEVQLANLKTGDGATVGAGDTAFVQYTGVKWSDGTVFDSSWDRGQPAAFPTNGVVAGFQQALEGQQVGSQVLVVIPPAAGYGAQEGSELQNETLVFVVDILGVQRTPVPAAG